MRSVGTVAPTMLIAAYGLLTVSRTVSRHLFARQSTLLLHAAIMVIGLLNVWRYFGFMPYDRAVWSKFQYTRETAIATYVQQTGQRVMVPPDVVQTDVFRYLTYDLPVDSFNPGDPPDLNSRPADVLVPSDADIMIGEWVMRAPVEPFAIPMHPYPGTETPTFWLYRAASER
jgi:hypothetical protein